MDQSNPQPLADPVPDRVIELKLKQFATSHDPHAPAGSPHVCGELDRYDMLSFFRRSMSGGGYRYTNARDAIAAAKRGRK